MRLILIVIALAILAGCPGTSVMDTKTPASIQVQQTQAAISRAEQDLTGPNGVMPKVMRITPANAAVAVPVAVEAVKVVDSDLQAAATQATSAEAQTEKVETVVAGQAKQIAELKASNPIKTWLEIIGLAAIVGGVGVLIASIFVTALQALSWLRSAAVGAVAFGLCLVAIAWFLTAIMWVVIGCIAAAAVFAVVWIVTHKTIRDAIATDIEGWFKVTPQQVATIPGLAAALGVSVQTTQKVVPTPAPNAVTP